MWNFDGSGFLMKKITSQLVVTGEDTLTVGGVSDLIVEKEGSGYKEGKTPAKKVQAEKRSAAAVVVRLGTILAPAMLNYMT
jgi:hypothetical protein